MRTLTLILPLLFLASCTEQEAAVTGPALKVGHYFQQSGRGRLCVLSGDNPQQVAFIAFGPSGNANCSASGTLHNESGRYSLQPKGEVGCAIPLSINGDQITIKAIPEACSYYCGPGVIPDLQPFSFSSDTTEVSDEPLSPAEAC